MVAGGVDTMNLREEVLENRPRSGALDLAPPGWRRRVFLHGPVLEE